MDLTKISEAEFLCEPNVRVVPQPLIDPHTLAEEIEAHNLSALPVLREYNDWKIIRWPLDGTVLLDAGNELAGYYIGDMLYVFEAARQLGLSVPLVLYAVAERVNLPISRTLTVRGEKALRKAWRVANGLEESPWWPGGEDQ